MDSRIDQCQEHEIEVLSEQLGSLKITKEVSQASIDYIDKMLTIPV